MATAPSGSFKDLPKSKPAPSVAELQAQLAAAEAALKGANIPTKPTAANPNPKLDLAGDTGSDAEPVVVEAVNEVSNPADFAALMLGGDGSDTMAALTAALETDGGSGAGLVFPTLTQVGGTSGGPFTAIETKNADLNVPLPEGKRAFSAVFVAYRYAGALWPEAKSDGGKPIGSVTVPASDGPNAALLMRAGKAFQFNRNRDRFSVSKGGPGIPKPSLEFLLYDEVIGLFVLRTTGHYNSAKDARDQLLACAAQQPDGSMKLLPFFGEFFPETHKQERAGKDAIIHHYPRIVKIDLTDARTGKAAAAYKSFVQKASADVRAKVTEWMAGSDAPLTSDMKDRLENAEGLA
jgi:hypothetical protein